MNGTSRQQQIDQNYDAFQRALAGLIPLHRDEFALMHDRSVIDFFPSAGAAYRAGLERFADGFFSIQEVTDEPISLGFYSVVRGS